MAIGTPVGLGQTNNLGGDATAITQNTSGTVPAGGRIFASVMYTAAAARTFTVSGGGLSWREDGIIQGSEGAVFSGTAIWSAYCPSGLASGTTITMTPSGVMDYSKFLQVYYCTGIAAGGAAAVDVTIGQWRAIPNTNWSTTAATLTVPNALIIAAAMGDDPAAVTSTATAPSVEIYDVNNVNQIYLTSTYEIVSEPPAAQSATGTWSTTPAAHDAAVMVAYKAAAPVVGYIGASTVPTATGTGTGTTTLSLTYPTLAKDDLLLMWVGVKPDTATITPPAGWTAVPNGELAGGGGTTGLDTGPTRAALYYKIADGSESGSVSPTLGNSPNCCMGQITVFRGSGGYAWNIAGANGADSTTGTPFTAAMGSNPGIEAGDMVAIMGLIPTGVSTPAQFSAETLTATGLTATVTEVSEPETTQGNDLGGVFCYATVYAGPATTAPTFSATAGGTTTNVRGPIVMARLRSDPHPLIPVAGAGPAAMRAANI